MHGPILEVLVAYGLSKEFPWLMIIKTCLLLMTVAFLFLHFIKKSSLRIFSHYVAGNHE